MKILYFFTRSDTISSGVFIHLRDLSERLINDGHEAAIAVGGDGPVFSILKEKNIPSFTIKSLQNAIHPINDTKALFEIIEIIKNYKPDLISAHTTKAGWLARLAGKITGIPVIYTPHGLAFADGVPFLKKQVYAFLEKTTIRLAKKVIAVCEYDKRGMLKHRVGSEDRIKVIYNGMNPRIDGIVANTSISPPKMVMVARFEEQKDHITLIRSLSNLKDLEWELDFFGDGPKLFFIQKLVSDLDLSERVHFKGTVSNLIDHLVDYQLFLLITNWEGFPRSILEAMSIGLPVVATDVGGVREAVISSENGFLVPHKDSEQLEEKLRLVLQDQEMRKRIADNNITKFSEEFTFQKMYFKYLDLYKSIIHMG